MNDNTNNLFEHIKNRLPTGFGYGDDGAVKDKNNKYNHKTFQQSLREDCEGDVGIFEIYTNPISIIHGVSGYESEIQIAVVCKQGNIEEAKSYLRETLVNIKTDKKSSGIAISKANDAEPRAMGKNDSNKQMVVIDIKINYLIKGGKLQ